MPLQCILIRAGLISKEGAELLPTVVGEGEYFAVVVTDLMAKVSENRAIRLLHARPQPFAVCVVAFRQVKGDDPVLIARDDLAVTAREQVECQTNGAVAHLDRKLKLIE